MLYDEALKIVESSTSFQVKYDVVNGSKVAMFGYRLADFNDFYDNNAFEMRGLTYVQDKNGMWSNPYLHLHKFFNLNQTTNYMMSDIKNKKLISVYDKLDGSMIRFIPINGKVFAKTKMSFTSAQAISAQAIYETNENIKTFVNYALKNNLAPIFEYVSQFNRIVVGYTFSDLVLIAVRNNETGEYLNIANFADKWKIRSVKTLNISFDEIINSIDSLKNIEGYVLHFDDNQMVKIKTSWYLEKHRLLTVDISSTDFLIKCVIENKIDDVYSSIPVENSEVRNYIVELTKKISSYVNIKTKKIENILKEYDGDRKKFAQKHNQDQDFHLIMQSINDNVTNKVKENILRKTNTLSKAKEFLDHI